MGDVERIEEQIRKLTPSEFAELRNWILEQDWDAWDAQIETDGRGRDNKLEELAQDAVDDHRSGRTRAL